MYNGGHHFTTIYLQTVRRKTLDKLTTQGNFYPMPSYMFLQDTTSRITLLSGQLLGVSSRETGVLCHPTPFSCDKRSDMIGVLEVVLDRRLSMDDNRGLGHGVMDNKVTLSSFRLLVEHRSSADSNVSTVSYFVDLRDILIPQKYSLEMLF